MTLTQRKEKLFQNIMRLRRAERQAPGSPEIVAVRTDLEAELGETVSRSLAARFLGLSHTALSRWIHRGDVPLVVTPEGRIQVPVAAVQDLYESVQAARESGRGHPLEPVIVEGHRRASRMDPQELVGDILIGAGSPDHVEKQDRHRVADLRSLAYHRALARRLRRPMANDALHLIWQWRDTGKLHPRYAKQWEDVLHRPLPEIKTLISEDSPAGRDLRQNSPFAGLLSEPERRRIVREVR